MRQRASKRASNNTIDRAASASTGGASRTPPAYGIDMVDQAQPMGASTDEDYAATQKMLDWLAREIGLSKEQLTSPGPERDRWINTFKNTVHELRTSGARQQLAALFRAVNRLYYAAKLTKQIGVFIRHGQYARYQIREAEGPEADIYFILGGLYLWGQHEVARQQAWEKEAADFRTRIPASWLVEMPTGDTYYDNWITTLVAGTNWQTFIHSYEHEEHGVSINNAPIVASLQSFLNHQFEDGRPLKPVAGMTYWPKPIEYYVGMKSGRGLFNAMKMEYGPVNITNVGAKGDRGQEHMPVWLKLGFNPLG